MTQAKAKANDHAIEQLLTPRVGGQSGQRGHGGRVGQKPRPARLWPGITNQTYRGAAKRMYHDEGTVEIDDRAKVSRSTDGGAYVQAWVWVENGEAL